MALVQNYSGADINRPNNNGTSRLLMMQLRFQQKQQEEKEHKLFAMLEEEHEGIPMIAAARTNSNGSGSHHNSASSTASLSSSLGSSLASSLGSTGSGTGGKVRQMFEERRNNNGMIGKPPMANHGSTLVKNPVRRNSPTKGWDRSYPLDPLPPTHERGKTTLQYPSKSRGVSLERTVNPNNTDGEIRRSKSQYQVYGNNGPMLVESPIMNPSDGSNPGLRHKSMASLLDDNQNAVVEPRRSPNRFGYGQKIRSPSEPRYSPNKEYGALPPSRHVRGNRDCSEDVPDGKIRPNINQTYRKLPANLYNTINGNGHEWEKEDEIKAAAAILAAEEAARKLEEEKTRIQAEAKKREQELMTTIRQQQLELQRLQQAAAQAEHKAKISAAAAARTTANSQKYRKPTGYNPRTPSDESDDSKSSSSDVLTSTPSKGWVQVTPKKEPVLPNEHVNPPIKPNSKPTIPPKPNAQRRSIFSTAAAGGKDGLVPCSICGRNFAADRVEKHQGVCAKTKSKKRKVFDITKMRVKGTEAETFVLKKPTTSHQENRRAAPQSYVKSTVSSTTTAPEDTGKKADWRKKHESFLETIRAAKAVQKHLKAGGNIADLPPPPPSDTSDYIQCPHCKRRFSPGAADRHIPKCANIKSNKPK